MQNLLPFWMENYFQHPSYLKVDNKPVLFIYRPEFLVQDLGGVENVAQAFERNAAGLPRGGIRRAVSPRRVPRPGPEAPGADEDPRPGLHLRLLLARAGQPHAPSRPSQAQMDYIRKTQELGILPQVVTVSQGWSGWRDEGSIWKIPPADYESSAAAGQGLRRHVCRPSSWAAGCCCWTTGTSGARATTSRRTASTASATSTPCARSSSTLRASHATLFRKTSVWGPTIRPTERTRNASILSRSRLRIEPKRVYDGRPRPSWR